MSPQRTAAEDGEIVNIMRRVRKRLAEPVALQHRSLRNQNLSNMRSNMRRGLPERGGINQRGSVDHVHHVAVSHGRAVRGPSIPGTPITAWSVLTRITTFSSH